MSTGLRWGIFVEEGPARDVLVRGGGSFAKEWVVFGKFSVGRGVANSAGIIGKIYDAEQSSVLFWAWLRRVAAVRLVNRSRSAMPQKRVIRHDALGQPGLKTQRVPERKSLKYDAPGQSGRNTNTRRVHLCLPHSHQAEAKIQPPNEATIG